jgi:hypothetical protein
MDPDVCPGVEHVENSGRVQCSSLAQPIPEAQNPLPDYFVDSYSNKLAK